MTTFSPLHSDIPVGKEDGPLHLVPLKWRRFPGSLRLWQPAWTWADRQGRTPSTVISLARAVPIKFDTYEPMETEAVLAFSKIASADDALAFADSYGFLGTEQDTAAASTGLAPISEMALEVRSVGLQSFDRVDRSVEILADNHEASDQLLVLTGTGIQDATEPSFWIHTSSRDLREHVSAVAVTSTLRRVRKIWRDKLGASSLVPHVKLHGLLVEPVGPWLEEASAMNELMGVWRTIEDKDVKALGRGVCPDWRELTETIKSVSPLSDARGHVDGLKNREPRDVLALAKEYLAQALNSRLQISNPLTFVSVDSNGHFKRHSRPPNLRAALWMQFSEIVTGARKIRGCEICGDLMDVTDNTRRKKIHNRCGQRECMQRYRRKSNGEKGKQ